MSSSSSSSSSSNISSTPSTSTVSLKNQNHPPPFTVLKNEEPVDASDTAVAASGLLSPTRKQLTLLGSTLIYFAAFGLINSFGFFQAHYTTVLLPSVPAATISFIGTLQITLMNVLAAPAGALYDCYGLKWLYISSGLGCAGALLALSFAQAGVLWQPFLMQGVLLGIAIAFGAQPALVVVGQHFVRQRALVMGIVAAAGSVGGVCFPIIFARLVPLMGFGWSLRAVAVIVACCYAASLAVSDTNHVHTPLKSVGTLLNFEGFLDRRYAVLAVGAFLAMLGQFVPYYYISTYCAIANPTSPSKDYLLPAMNASSFVGRIFGGLIATYLGPLNTTTPMTILSGIFCLALWLCTSMPSVLVLFAVLYGFSSGVFIAVLPAIIAQLCPTLNLGARIGAFYSVCAVAQLVGSPIGGALIKTRSGQEGGEVAGGGERYAGLIVFAGITLLVGGFVMFVSRLLHDKNLRTRI